MVQFLTVSKATYATFIFNATFESLLTWLFLAKNIYLKIQKMLHEYATIYLIMLKFYFTVDFTSNFLISKDITSTVLF